VHEPQANLGATIDTSEPYIGAIRGTVHEPQANLGVDKKFLPGRSKTQKGSLSKY